MKLLSLHFITQGENTFHVVWRRAGNQLYHWNLDLRHVPHVFAKSAHWVDIILPSMGWDGNYLFLDLFKFLLDHCFKLFYFQLWLTAKIDNKRMLYGSPSLQGLPEPGHTTIAIISRPVQPRSRCANTEDTDAKTCKTTKPGSTFGATNINYTTHTNTCKHMFLEDCFVTDNVLSVHTSRSLQQYIN